MQRHPARLLGDGRGARLGDRVALGRRPGRRSRRGRRPTSASATEFTQKAYGNIFLLVVGGGDRRLPVRAAAADGRPSATGPSGPPPRPRSGSGWLGWCTTACCRCWRWCSVGLRSSAPTAPSWAGWPASRRRGCVRWCSRTPASRCARRRPGPRAAAGGAADRPGARRHAGYAGDRGRGDARSEVVAAVEACLSNVRHHVGRDAEAWVLLEDLGDRWVVSVRDDGPGHRGGSAGGVGRRGSARGAAVDRRPDAATSAAPPTSLRARPGHRVGAGVPRHGGAG